MKKVIVAIFGTLLFASPAFAQNNQGADKRAFFFGAPGVIMGTEATTVHVGGGVETVWSNGLGFAFDAGYFTGSDFGNGALSFSPAIIYEFPVNGRVKPYVRAGGTLLANRASGLALWTVGGGINYWFKDRMGLKVEIRDSFLSEDPSTGLLDVMMGLVFRY